MKIVKENQPEIVVSSQLEQDKTEIDKFLSEINSYILEIRNSDQKQYSILSSIFNCFYENKKTSLPKQIIFEYIHQDVINYKRKMIVSFVENGTNSMEIIDENNYIKKTHSIISRNKCLVQDINNQISIDMNFIQVHRNLIYRNLFGKDGKLFTLNQLKIKKFRKPRINISDNMNTKIGLNRDNQKEESIDVDDYEIEIVESEQDETDSTELKKANKTFSYNNNIKSEINNITKNNIIPDSNDLANTNINNSINLSKKNTDIHFLNKKRKSRKPIIYNKKDIINEGKEDNYKDIFNKLIEEDLNNKFDEKSNEMKDIEEENTKEKKEEIIAEKEILSLMEEGKIFLSLFKDKELLNEFENQNNTTDESDSFIKSILLSYQNEDTLKKYLNILNDDYTEFQKSLKSLINYKCSLDDSNNNKFLTKFSIMNKIILGKEKCSLLIDKIVIKLKQLILEYNFIKKVLKNIDNNKTEIFMKFKDIMTNNSNKQEKDNYVNNLKTQLQDELSKALILGKDQNIK